MPNILDIRRRIRSVKNTQQITKAMKMVSAAKLRRAQERVMSARPYAQKILSVLNSLVTRSEGQPHPLAGGAAAERIQVVVITADKGLCGAFNSQHHQSGSEFHRREQHRAAHAQLRGTERPGIFPQGFAAPCASKSVNIFARLDYSHAKQISATLMEEFSNKEVDAVYLVYNEFKSVIQQRIVVEQLLPIQKLSRFQRKPA